MEIVLFFIPFLAALLLLIFCKEKIVWWEYIVVIIPTVLMTLLIKVAMVESNCMDTEYYGGYVTKVRHYDEWDEWIEQRCTRQVAVGRDEDGNTIYEEEEYDCSYRQYHSQYWVYYSSLSRGEHNLTEQQFNAIRYRFNSPMVFVDMHRHYYRIDGDAQDYMWPGTRNTIRTITEAHEYKNKVQASNSIFNFKDISKKEAKKLNLFDYPKITDFDQNPILNQTVFSVSQKEIDDMKYFNGFYGKPKQIRVYVLLFDAKDDISKAYDQQSYWKGGNKNELVTCFALDTARTIKWCYSFSWEDDQKMAIGTMEKYRNEDKLDISEYADWLIQNVNKWKRKEFKDFGYLRPELKTWQQYLLFILTLLFSLGASIFCIMNEYENEDFKK